jgi:hypothetical protein
MTHKYGKSKELCFEVLDVLFLELRLLLQFYQKKYPIFSAVIFFSPFLVIKTLDSELDPDLQLRKMLDPEPH